MPSGVKIVVSGKAVVKWSQKSERPDKDGHYRDETFSGQEDYFSSKFFLLGSDSGGSARSPILVRILKSIIYRVSKFRTDHRTSGRAAVLPIQHSIADEFAWQF